ARPRRIDGDQRGAERIDRGADRARGGRGRQHPGRDHRGAARRPHAVQIGLSARVRRRARATCRAQAAMAPPQWRRYKVPMTTLAVRNDLLWRYAPLVLLLGSGGLLLGALFFQYVKGLPPCPLCHWQRWPHIAVVVLAAGALAIGPGAARPWLLALIGLALLATAAIGIFHAGVEQK